MMILNKIKFLIKIFHQTTFNQKIAFKPNKSENYQTALT